MRRIEQIPTLPNEWLCTDLASDDCIFAKKVLRSSDSTEWAECTNEEKEEWEREHPQPEPEPQTETEESVEQPTE